MHRADRSCPFDSRGEIFSPFPKIQLAYLPIAIINLLLTLVGQPYRVSPGPACRGVGTRHAVSLRLYMRGTPFPAATCARRNACTLRASRFRNAFTEERRFAAVKNPTENRVSCLRINQPSASPLTPLPQGEGNTRPIRRWKIVEGRGEVFNRRSRVRPPNRKGGKGKRHIKWCEAPLPFPLKTQVTKRTSPTRRIIN